MQGTVTDAAAMAAAGLEEPFVGDSANAYQEFTRETAIYPRVYTEDQVRNMLIRFVGREAAGLANHGDDLDSLIENVNEIAPRYLDEFETEFSRLVYPVLGLVGEAGEVANKLKKVARDGKGAMGPDGGVEIAKEMGDVQWYVARIVDELGVKLGNVLQDNVVKLFSRKRRGVLGGSGDNR